MAIETRCQTEGATYSFNLSGNKVSMEVVLPFDLNISEEDASLIESNLHNVFEIVISGFFKKSVDVSDKIVKFGDWKY